MKLLKLRNVGVKKIHQQFHLQKSQEKMCAMIEIKIMLYNYLSQKSKYFLFKVDIQGSQIEEGVGSCLSIDFDTFKKAFFLTACGPQQSLILSNYPH